MRFIKGVKNLAPGMGATLFVGLLAYWTNRYLPGFGVALWSLLFGILAGNIFLRHPALDTGIRFVEKYVLEAAIVLIGFGFKLSVLTGLGWGIFAWIAASVVVVVLFSALVGKWLGMPSGFNYLLGAGSAICGSAAVAAASPLIKADEEETGLALALINLLGLLGILFLPALSIILHYSDLQAGIFTGGILQSMGHVAAASFTLNENTGDVAMVVKMIRISLLAPFLLFLAFRTGSRPGNSSASFRFPLFVILFTLSVTVGQLNVFPEAWLSSLADGGDILLFVAMAAIGLKIKLKPLLKISFKGSMTGLIVFLFQILIFALLIALDIL